ncbi:MAG: lysophospholipid acyltransferase family protein [Pseudomonadota bacterium]
MSRTWHSEDGPPAFQPLTPAGVIRAVMRGVPLAINTFGCLALLLLLRLIEGPVFGAHRPLTPQITRYVCRSAFLILGMGYRVEGRPMTAAGAVVANHVSWLDIFALNAPQPVYFVSKSEVAEWPGIGWLARATGTIFIRRDRRDAAAQKSLLGSRLAEGHKLVFFPEGTSTDGRRVLDFQSTLFAAFFEDGLVERLSLQPVSLVYEAPEGQDPRFYGWWGDMSFEGHLLRVLSARRQGRVRVIFHAPMALSELPDRKAAARQLHARVAQPVAQSAGKAIADG